MNRASAAILLFLVTIAAVEFGLLGVSASGLSGRDHSLPPVGERMGVEPATATSTSTTSATATTTPAICGGQSCPVSGLTIIADPLAILCDGSQTSHVRVRILDVFSQPIQVGTNVYFEPYNGNTEPSFAQTNFDGYVETDVRFYDDIFPYGPNLIVHADLLQAGIRILCFPQSDECIPTTPPSSPPCGPTQTPTPTPCVVSPPSTPPCAPPPPSPPECPPPPPAISPPCVPRPTPPVSPPPVSPPVRTTTAPARTSTAVPRTATVAPTRTHLPNRCADVSGNGHVTASDVRIIARAVLQGQYRAAYDLNRDGLVSQADVIAAAKQFGRRC